MYLACIQFINSESETSFSSKPMLEFNVVDCSHRSRPQVYNGILRCWMTSPESKLGTKWGEHCGNPVPSSFAAANSGNKNPAI
ncbi:hypothetical protein PSHT_14823 [Puccinia striiformis]|uniref:Uncharacterized protein n=1 Tax=Puccinia striiformis TaxID=27350 RepID=A0A2S4UIN6_9BASI|nr:hypothetical protein PSHT_14823 [Puccinia striiformis]